MLGFLKKLFPKKGDDWEDLDDMYKEDQAMEQDFDDDVPRLSDEGDELENSKFGGILPGLLRKFKKKSADDDYEPAPTDSSYLDDEYAETEDSDVSDSSDGLLNKINNLEGAPKFAFLGVVTILVAVAVYSGMKLFNGGSSKKGSLPQRPPVEQQATEKTAPASQNNPMQVATAQSGPGMENPFKDGVAFDNPNASGLTQSPGQIPASARALPQIPYVPRPNIPAGMTVPSPTPTTPQAPAASNVVQGVITGNNEKENVAIMGDGKVVSVGETYNDGRIAYIGGDGITFEDGRQIKIKP